MGSGSAGDPGVTTGHLVEALTGRRWDPATVTREVLARSARYERRGLRAGDRVFLHLGNRLEFFAELLAVWRLGGCAVPVDGRLTAFEVERLRAAAAPRFAVVDDVVDPAAAANGADVEVIDATETCPPAAAAPAPRARPQDDALILFTSGSTGEPKGVVHTHASLRARWTALEAHLGLASYARTLCLLPTHFGHGLICNSLFPWLAGQDLFVTPPFRAEILVRLGALIDEHRITFLSSVPALWRLVLRMARPPGGGTLRRVHCGSAPLSAALWERIRGWAGTLEVFNTYGLTETGSWVAGTSIGPFTPADGLIGEPWGATLEVRRAADAESVEAGGSAPPCAPGEVGHLWIKTPALMRGYLDRDALTRRVVVDGWLATGDLGRLDERAGCICAAASATRSTRAASRSPPRRWTRRPRASRRSRTPARSRWTMRSTARTWGSRWPSTRAGMPRCTSSTTGCGPGSPRPSCRCAGGCSTRSPARTAAS